jgi:hypothetical protein
MLLVQAASSSEQKRQTERAAAWLEAYINQVFV